MLPFPFPVSESEPKSGKQILVIKLFLAKFCSQLTPRLYLNPLKLKKKKKKTMKKNLINACPFLIPMHNGHKTLNNTVNKILGWLKRLFSFILKQKTYFSYSPRTLLKVSSDKTKSFWSTQCKETE